MKNYNNFFIYLFFLNMACNNKKIDNTFLLNNLWKFYDGQHLGDVLIFTNSYCKMQNDTVFINDTAKATFIKFEKYYFENKTILTLKVLSTDSLSFYILKKIEKL